MPIREAKRRRVQHDPRRRQRRYEVMTFATHLLILFSASASASASVLCFYSLYTAPSCLSSSVAPVNLLVCNTTLLTLICISAILYFSSFVLILFLGMSLYVRIIVNELLLQTTQTCDIRLARENIDTTCKREQPPGRKSVPSRESLEPHEAVRCPW